MEDEARRLYSKDVHTAVSELLGFLGSPPLNSREADWIETIGGILRRVDGKMTTYVDGHSSGDVKIVLRRSLIFNFKNLIEAGVKEHITDHQALSARQLRQCTLIEESFRGLFAEELKIHRQVVNPVYPAAPNVPGPNDFTGHPGNEKRGPDPGDDDFSAQKRARTDLDFNNACVILDNLHKRLSALELRMSA
jgi:hypothetical protein